MARKKREWFPGAVYHIIHRGVRKQVLFEEEYDYQMFLYIMRLALDEYKCILHAYCLMTNHVHLLLETTDYEVGKFMKFLSERYAMYYNRKYCYIGHVFESRYKSCLVKDDAYFLQTSRYIHLNPVKAMMVSRPEHYRWSSYNTITAMWDDQITSCQKTLAYFPDHGVVQYEKFVDDTDHKFADQELEIRKNMEEDELWFPF